MPPWTYLLVEGVAFLFGILLVRESWRGGGHWLSTLLVAMGFGFSIEMFFVTVYSGYSYGDFLIDLTIGGHNVPLWVAVGWGTIIYTAMKATDRMGLPWFQKPAMDALLAVSLDITLDPIAEALGWWYWTREGQFFGVPFDNFIGWLMIVGLYSFYTRAGWELTKSKPKVQVLMPLAALVASALSVAGFQIVLEKALYPHLGEPYTFFGIATTLVAAALVPLWKATAGEKPQWYLWMLPAAYHGLMVVLLFLTEVGVNSPELLLFFPLAAFTSLALFTHPRM
jgi:hypothetical protein